MDPKNLMKPSLAEIKERAEESAKKHANKILAQADVKTRSKMFSSIQCPICLRKFGEKAAEAHIKYCKEKAKLLAFANKNK